MLLKPCLELGSTTSRIWVLSPHRSSNSKFLKIMPLPGEGIRRTWPTAARRRKGRPTRARTWPTAARRRWGRPTTARTWPTAARTRWGRPTTARTWPTAARGRCPLLLLFCHRQPLLLLLRHGQPEQAILCHGQQVLLRSHKFTGSATAASTAPASTSSWAATSAVNSCTFFIQI